jgi:hypothetical protein
VRRLPIPAALVAAYGWFIKKSGPSAKTQKENTMAYGVIHHFPGGTKAQYEASIAAVHPSRDKLPKGQLFHAAGASAGGYTIVAIHESKESWELFRDKILGPKLQAGVPGGFTSAPQETVFAVDNQQLG